MKTFIAAIVTFSILCGTVIWNDIYVKKVTADLLENCEKLPLHTAIENEREASVFSQTIKEIESTWNRARFVLCLFVHHAEADAIEETIGELTVRYHNADKAGYASARRMLAEKIRELQKSESFSIEGIL